MIRTPHDVPAAWMSGNVTGCLMEWENYALQSNGVLSMIRWASIFMIHHTHGLQLNLYLYQHDRKSFGNQQRIFIVSVWKEQGLTHWKGFRIHNWLCPVSLCSFLCTLITVTQSDNRLLSQSPKLSFQQRLLESEITSHIAPHYIPHTHPLSDRVWNKRPLNYLITQFTSDDENIFPLTFSSKTCYV